MTVAASGSMRRFSLPSIGRRSIGRILSWLVPRGMTILTQMLDAAVKRALRLSKRLNAHVALFALYEGEHDPAPSADAVQMKCR